MFELPWIQLYSAKNPPMEGDAVGVLAQMWGLWFLNIARVVYCFDEKVGHPTRFGFAYGTLPCHEEIGEERFAIEWNQEDGRVYYALSSFSTPRRWAFRVVAPLIQHHQRRFAFDSLQAFQRAMEETAHVLPPLV
jgi:uncharacterized protein (UPF0548 family)